MSDVDQEAPSRLVPDPHGITPELGTPTGPRRITVDGREVWMMSRHEDVRTCLAHPDLTRPATYARGQGWPTPFAKLFDNTLFSTDPPEHTRLRRLLQRAFTTRRVQALRPRIQEITESLLDRIAPRGHADLVTDLALPLPAQVMSELLGVPPADRDRFCAWADTMLWPGVGPDAMRAAHEAGEQFWAYIQRLTDAKAGQHGDDLISALLSEHDEDRMTYQEVVATARFMLVSGFETTANLVVNGMRTLLVHPDQLAKLRADAGLIPTAVEELLRYDGPGIINARYAKADVRIAGIDIRRGEAVVLDLDAANRDPAKFERAEELDLTRQPNPHVQFGHGWGHCLGASLARLEGQIAIGELVSRFPDLSLDRDPDELLPRPEAALRSLSELPVRFTPRSP